MKETIVERLRELAARENIRILLAVESGSRAWGFASPDSDFDVRFIYLRAKNDYLRLDAIRDVIELPMQDELDINGWDLKKTLQLLYRSNPTLFEWFSSPLVYLETDFADAFRSIMSEYFSAKRALYHYISMAEGNYRDDLKRDQVRAKKYFYVLRPILACHWILEKGTPPPMQFSELMTAHLPMELSARVAQLLALKINSPEVKVIPRIDVINAYLDTSIADIKDRVAALPDEKRAGWTKLNEFFLRALHNGF